MGEIYNNDVVLDVVKTPLNFFESAYLGFALTDLVNDNYSWFLA